MTLRPNMKSTVWVITPAVDTGAIPVDESLEAYRSSHLEVRHLFLEEGPESIESEMDVQACLPGLLSAARSIDVRAADVVVVNCMCDPGVRELRTLLPVPVLGPAQTSMHVAAALGRRFSVLDVLAEGRADVERQIEEFGLSRSYASHRALGIRVLDLFRDKERTLAALEREARAAFSRDGADTLLLGCTGLAGLAAELNVRLRADKSPHRILEPLQTTLGVARTLVEMATLALQ